MSVHIGLDEIRADEFSAMLIIAEEGICWKAREDAYLGRERSYLSTGLAARYAPSRLNQALAGFLGHL